MHNPRNNCHPIRTAALVAALLAGGALQAWPASFRVTFTMPTQDNPGACGATTGLIAHPLGHRGRAILRWSGPVAGADSISNLADGDSAVFVRSSVPAGTYTFRAAAWDSGGYSCDVVIQRTLVDGDTTKPAPPASVRILP